MKQKKYDLHKIMREVNDTNFFLLGKEPFFSHLFSGLIKSISTKIPTACIALNQESSSLSLIINPDFWNEKLIGETNNETRNYRYGLVKHEILHIVYKHIFRVKDFSNKKLFNIAADIVVNQQLKFDELIEGACTIEKFPEFNLEYNKGVDYYYKKLSKEWDDIQKQQSKDSSDGKKEDSDSNSDGDSNAEQREQSDKQEKGSGQSNDPNLNKSQNNLKNFMGAPDDHSEWNKILDELGENKHLVEDKIEQQIKEIAEKLQNNPQEWGRLPSYIKDFIKESLKTKKKSINWKKVFRRFTSSSIKTYIKGTIRRPSKRYGTTPGIKLKRKQKLLVAIDTSGSVDNESLASFFAEIYHIWKTGAEVRIVECDVTIGKTWNYKGKPPTEITGRGGTSFDAPFAYANEYMPDAIIYFTDGYCCPPRVKTRVKKQMWVLQKNGAKDLKQFKKEGFKGIKVKMT